MWVSVAQKLPEIQINLKEKIWQKNPLVGFEPTRTIGRGDVIIQWPSSITERENKPKFLNNFISRGVFEHFEAFKMTAGP